MSTGEGISTYEELELHRCATDNSFAAMTSSIMKINIVFSITVVLLTFWYSYNAIILLIHRNIYSNCSRILLVFNLIDSNIWQTNYAIIRIRELAQIIQYSDNQCEIQFQYEQCTFQHTISYFCVILSVFCIISLTLDRFLSFFLTNFYAKHQKTIPALMIGIIFPISVLIYLWGFYGVPQVGYVPSCTYPPYLSIPKFSFLNNTLFCFICINFILSSIILAVNTSRDSKLHHSNFNTSTRYISFENLETTKAIFSISTTQFFFLTISALGAIVVQFFSEDMDQKIYHLLVPFFTAVLYGNLSIPVLVCYQTNKSIARRKKTIGSMTSATDTMETRMSGLREMWN